MLPGEENCVGIVTPCTASGPSASAAMTAVTAESMPPLNPSTTDLKPTSRRNRAIRARARRTIPPARFGTLGRSRPLHIHHAHAFLECRELRQANALAPSSASECPSKINWSLPPSALQ